MRSLHTTFLVAAVLFIVGILVGNTSLATPVHALTITFPEKGFPKVEAGTVLGETSLDKPDSTSSPVSAKPQTEGGIRNTANNTSEQREQGTKATRQANSEKEQAQKLQKLLQTTKPAELELKKNKDDQDVTVSLRELEKRKGSSGSEDNKGTFEKREVGITQDSWQPKEGIPNKADEHVDSVEVKLRKDLEVKSTQEGLDVKNSAIKASTTLPVQINTNTKELSVVTPNGTKVVRTLPDEAVLAIQNSGLNGQVVGEVKLEAQGNDLVYKVKKEQYKKMFGLMPVTIKQDVQVSATTGEVTTTQQSITDRIFNFFSF